MRFVGVVCHPFQALHRHGLARQQRTHRYHVLARVHGHAQVVPRAHGRVRQHRQGVQGMVLTPTEN